MSDLQNGINTLIDKLTLAKEVYSTGAEKVHDKPTAMKLEILAERKGIFLSELNDVLDSEVKDRDLPVQERIKVEIEKLTMEVDHLLLRINEGEVLKQCIGREDDLSDIYDKLLHLEEIDRSDSALKGLLIHQNNYTQKSIAELKNVKDQYVFEPEK